MSEVRMTNVAYIVFRRHCGGSGVKELLVPGFLIHLHNHPPKDYTGRVSTFVIGRYDESEMFVPDSDATMKERMLCMERLPRVVAIDVGSHHYSPSVELHVKVMGDTPGYEKWDGKILKPFSEGDYVFKTQAAVVYAGFRYRRDFEGAAEGIGVYINEAMHEVKGRVILPQRNVLRLYLLEELNELRQGKAL